jgi:hypothetical protein
LKAKPTELPTIAEKSNSDEKDYNKKGKMTITRKFVNNYYLPTLLKLPTKICVVMKDNLKPMLTYLFPPLYQLVVFFTISALSIFAATELRRGLPLEDLAPDGISITYHNIDH